jgi:alpha-L-fucosidase 2
MQKRKYFYSIARIVLPVCYMIVMTPRIGSCSPAKNIIKTYNNGYATRMWYTRPAVNWNEALPIGNRRLGAMIFEGIATERISLNEQTLWSGAPSDGNNSNAKKYLPLVRQAALNGEYKKADSLSKFMQGPYTESYMPMADLIIMYKGITDSSFYTRELDMDSALAKVIFGDKAKRFARTSFASFPDQVIVLQERCNVKSSVSFTAMLSSKLRYKVSTISQNHIVLTGKCPKHVQPAYLWRLKDSEALVYASDEKGEGMNFEVHLLIQKHGGTFKADENGITIENANTRPCLFLRQPALTAMINRPIFKEKVLPLLQ